jgi:hypothetical protein
MPKERFHLLLTDLYQSRKSIAPAGQLRDESLVVSIGAISPDIFFYDLPSFSLSTLGSSLHDLTATNGITPILNWLTTTPTTRRAKLWAVGFAGHFLADATWHPVIDDLSATLQFCKTKGLTEGNCHLFLESEMEAFWLPKIGKPGSYIDLLGRFRADREWLVDIAAIYRQFLQYAGLAPPSVARIRRCFLNQNFMLRLFANKLMGKKRDFLLAMPPTRYIAALLVPAKPVLPARLDRQNHPALELFDNHHLETELTSLFARLADFEQRLSLSLPS